MTDHSITRPQVFISHATSDADFANVVADEIKKVFAGGVDVFSTSSPGSIRAGDDWLQQIERKLEQSRAVIALITPISIERPWLWFELGATWEKSRMGACRIYPLCAPEIDIGKLPSPLDRLQALSMAKATDLQLFFSALIQQFGFGMISSFTPARIIDRIPKYSTVKMNEADWEGTSLHSGQHSAFSGYSDEELMEIIDDFLFGAEKDELDIRNGKLLHYRELDEKLGLPHGSTKRLLKPVAKRHSLQPLLDTEHLIRFDDLNANRGYGRGGRGGRGGPGYGGDRGYGGGGDRW